MSENLKKLGRYNIASRIGEGGMGVVYKAVDPVLERSVALKVGKFTGQGLPGADSEEVASFIREARLAAQFIHPNIAIVYDAGFEGNLFYMAIEYIEGTGLGAHTARGSLLPKITVLEMIFNICHALDYIHERGCVHLDIKPSNIMRTRLGQVKLMDFGIARFLRESGEGEREVAGSFHYMSPEQADAGAELTPRSDIFSLGVVLYELLTGRRPFEGENLFQVLYKMTHEAPVPADKHTPDLSPELSAVISRSIHPDPARRFASAKAFADALLPVIKGKDTGALDAEEKKKTAFLKKLICFKHFQYADLAELIKISSWRVHRKGGTIVEAQNDDSNIYFVVHGRASIIINKVKKVFDRGDCFGESAVLYNMPRQAPVIAETDCVVMAVNANLLNQSRDALQVKFLKEFYKVKLRQLVETNLKLIQAESRSVPTDSPYSETETGLLLTRMTD